MNRISVIIPVLNESDGLSRLLPYLKDHSGTDSVCEYLVVDGGSTDGSPEIAERLGARVIRSEKGRALQMNAGAREAKGRMLYFLHADSFPPEGYDQYILKANAGRPVSGCFRLKFDDPNRVLGFFAWFTRLNILLCRGGDQSLFIPAAWFRELGGFNEAYQIYEDNEFIQRIYRRYTFKVLRPYVVTSARKYRRIGVWKLQYYFGMIHLLKFLGARPEALYRYYRNKIA
jgi:rSAM/selenodomain-associated transferase 2